MKPQLFALDVDGVLTTGQMLYSKDGKSYKVFGPDDHDALNLLRGKLEVVFLTADKRGLPISQRRVVDEMKFPLELVHPAGRLAWLQSRGDLRKTIYMGDGIFDTAIFEKVGYAICTANGFYQARQAADFVTHHNGGDRAVAEAVAHVLQKFFGQSKLEFNDDYGVWNQKGKVHEPSNKA